MARQEAKLEINQFTGGLNTDTTELTTPENTSVDELNFDLLKEGTRRRRLGMDLEDTDTIAVSTTAETDFIGNHRWESVGKIGDLNFEVIQVGNTLHFFDSSVVPLVDGKKSFTVNLDTFKAPLADRTDLTHVSMASGKGALFVAGTNIVPFYITYDFNTDSIVTNRINIKIRDLTQLDTQSPESGDLTPQRKYDLLNQGWYQTDVIIGSSTQVISIKTKSKNPNTSIPGYAGTILDGYIATFGAAPPKTKPWWVGKGTITVDIHIKKPGIFNDIKETKEVEAFSKEAYDLYFGGNTVAPLGHYIIDPFYKDRTAVSGINGLSTEVETKRPGTVAFYGGRAFYGIDNTIYFSQIILDDLKASERCYQEADPTSEDTIGLVASDGGVITIPDMGEIIRMVVVEGALVIFADNGVWTLYSSQGRGFSATNFTVDFVTPLSAVGYFAIVDVEGYPVYWGESGIYALSPIDERIAYQVQDLTDKKIKNYYSSIPPLSKRYAKGGYDLTNRRIIWLWKTDTDPNTNRFVYDRVLNYSITFNAFFPYSIAIHEGTSDPDFDIGVCGIVNANDIATDSINDNVVVGSTVDPFWSDVRFYYPLDTTNGYADIGPNTLSDGTPQSSNIVSNAFFPRESAHYGNSNAVTLPQFSVPSRGTDPWTVEFWYQTDGEFLTPSGVAPIFYAKAATSATVNAIYVAAIGSTDAVRVQLYDSAGSLNSAGGSIDIISNTIHYISVTRDGNSVYVHVDGTLQFTMDVTGKQYNFAAGMSGDNLVSLVSTPTPQGAYIGEVKWTNAARYSSSNYVVPSQPGSTSDTSLQNVVSENDGDVIVSRTFITETAIGLKFIAIQDITNDTTGARLGFSDFTDTAFVDWTSTTAADDYESYIETFYHLTDDSMLYMQAPWIFTYIKKTSNTFPDAEGSGSITDGDVGGGWNNG